MTLDEIHAEWKKDAVIQKTKLDDESMRTSELYQKYLEFYSDARVEAMNAKALFDVEYKNKFYYYNGWLSHDELKEQGLDPFPMKVLKTDMDIFMNADAKIIRLKAKLDMANEKVGVLDKILRSLNTRQFAIRDGIDFIKLTTGF